MKTQMHANVCKKKCLAAITAMLMAALLVVPANVKAVAGEVCTEEKADLSADFLLSEGDNDNTGKDDIEVGKNDNMTFVGILGFRSINNKINSFEANNGQISSNNINPPITVTLTLKLAEGLKFKDVEEEATLTSANVLFADPRTMIIEEENRQKAIINIGLKNGDKYATYGDLKKAVNELEDNLKVSLPSVQFADNAEADKEYTVTGEVEVSFGVNADALRTTKCFNFKCNGEKVIKVKYAAPAPAPDPAPVPAPTQVKPEIEIPYVPSDPVKPVVEEEAKVGKVAKTGEMANTVNQLGLIILAAASVVIAKKH